MKLPAVLRRWGRFKPILLAITASLMLLVLSFTLSRSSQSFPKVARGLAGPPIPNTGVGRPLGLQQASPTKTAQPEGTPKSTDDHEMNLPVVSRTDISRVRPYSSNSVWNKPIGANPEYDPHSAEMVATIGLNGEGNITSDPDQYSYPVYYADENTPRWDIPCTRYKCTVVDQHSIWTTSMLSNVPIPSGARPSTGTDGQMIIIDRVNYTEYDLYEAKRTADGWTVSNASTYNIFWDGTPSRYGSRGAGVPYFAGLIRPWEIEQGEIEHAIAFAYPEPAEDQCVYPATKTDGKSNLPYAIPQGARLQLDPTLTETDFDRMGLSRTGKIIARALQKYGMILIDTSGRAKIYVENLKDNPFAESQWTDPELNLNSNSIAGIPYTIFRVLKLPEGYWNPGKSQPTYGDCYR